MKLSTQQKVTIAAIALVFLWVNSSHAKKQRTQRLISPGGNPGGLDFNHGVPMAGVYTDAAATKTLNH